MKLFYLFALLVALCHSSPLLTKKEVCCGDLGCFSNDGIFFDLFYRPLSSAPNCAATNKFKLELNTRLNPIVTQNLDPYTPGTIQLSNFDKSLETKILIHGFTDHYDWDWWKAMVAALLKEGNFNVIRLDWSSGNTPPYMQASANTRTAGAFVAKFINLLKFDEISYSPSKIHIIGHSLGAHTAGYAGERVTGDKVGRISGIDPAGLYFQYMEPTVRLDSSDAVVVDTVVTDGESILSLGFGSMQAMGHMNFYVNGGNKQPGCGAFLTGTWSPSSFDNTEFDWSSSAMQTLYQTVGCNHWRALSLYIESIGVEKCPMSAERCSSFADYLFGQCRRSNGAESTLMGYMVDTTLVEDGVAKNFYTQTTDRPPFCTKSLQLTLGLQAKTSANDAREQKGIVFLTLIGYEGTISRLQITPETVTLTPGESLNLVFPIEEVGEVQKVVFSWEDKSILGFGRKHYVVLHENLLVEDATGQVLTYQLIEGYSSRVEEKQDAWFEIVKN